MLRELMIRTLTAMSWRSSRRRLALALHRFSLVEADSAWQMLQALRDTRDPIFRAKLFGNALEEVHHAALFAGLARQYADQPLPPQRDRRERLYHPARGMAEFEAYHFIGEANVLQEFLSYSRAAGDEQTKRMFLEIRGDEVEHQKLALAELKVLVGSRHGVRKLLWRVRCKRGYREWIRFGTVIGDIVSAGILATIYFVAGPMMFLACRRRISQHPVTASG